MIPFASLSSTSTGTTRLKTNAADVGELCKKKRHASGECQAGTADNTGLLWPRERISL